MPPCTGQGLTRNKEDRMKTIALEEADLLVKNGENYTAEELKKVQNERLHALVDYARENSPYMRELYKDLPDDYTLQDLPATDKKDLLEHYNDWVTDPDLTEEAVRKYLKRDSEDTSLLLGKYTALQTSGSTGNPLPMVRDDYHNKIHGALLRNRLFYGLTPGLFDHSRHKMAFLVHISNSASSYGSYLKLRRLRPGFEENIAAFPITDSIEVLTKKLNDFQPEIITAYPPVLVMLAEEKLRGTLDIPLKLLLSSAELLTEESYHRIHDVFGVPILNNYCMTEGGEIAMTHDCPHLHINEDWVIVEPVDENRQPMQDASEYSSGILVTDLTNYVQPIIRYYVSDSVRIRREDFPCYSRPVLDIRGRVWDSFTLGGQKFTTKALEVKAKFQKGLCSYQFVQRDDNTLELRGICAADSVPEDVLSELAGKLAAYFHEAGAKDARVTFSTEPPISNAAGGKTPMFKKNRPF